MIPKLRTALVAGLLLGLSSCGSSTSGDHAPAPDPAAIADQRVAEISNGGEVEIDPYLQEGVRTIVEFGAVW